MLHTWSYFDDWINGALGAIEKEFSPKWRRDDERGGWKLSFVLPGVKKDEIDVTSSHGVSRVKHPNGSLRISLPKDVDYDLLEAKLDLGIFELFAPDMKESRGKKINVQ